MTHIEFVVHGSLFVDRIMTSTKSIWFHYLCHVVLVGLAIPYGRTPYGERSRDILPAN